MYGNLRPVYRELDLLSGDVLVGGSVEAGPQHLHLRHQLGQSEVDVLVVEERLAESFPLPEVLDSLGYDQVHRGHAQGGTGYRGVLTQTVRVDWFIPSLSS